MASPVWAGEKTDTLVLQNGNEITGEVKGLDQGQLTYKTNDLGTLSGAWDSVASIVSKKPSGQPQTCEGTLKTRYVHCACKPTEVQREVLMKHVILRLFAVCCAVAPVSPIFAQEHHEVSSGPNPNVETPSPETKSRQFGI